MILLSTIDTIEKLMNFLTGKGKKSENLGERDRIFELVVNQAMKGAPWQSLYTGALTSNKIRPEEIEAEIRRRKGLV